MKINWITVILLIMVLGLLAFAFAFGARPSHADGLSGHAPVVYDGHLDLKAPTWDSRSGYISSTNPLELCGIVKAHNLFGNLPLTPFVSGDYTFGTKITAPKREIQAGGEYALGRDLCFFSYWDRHFIENVDRVFVGIRLGFSSGG